MALPTKANLQTMDYSYLGEPFCYVPAKDSISLDGMDYSYLGEPFWAIVTSVVVTSAIKTFNGLAKASVKTVNGLAIASVKTINGLA